MGGCQCPLLFSSCASYQLLRSSRSRCSWSMDSSPCGFSSAPSAPRQWAPFGARTGLSGSNSSRSGCAGLSLAAIGRAGCVFARWTRPRTACWAGSKDRTAARSSRHERLPKHSSFANRRRPPGAPADAATSVGLRPPFVAASGHTPPRTSPAGGSRCTCAVPPGIASLLAFCTWPR